MKYSFYLFITLLFFTACGSNDKAEPGAENATTDRIEDSANVASDENALPPKTITFFNESGFSRYAKSKSAQFDWNNFVLSRFWKEDSLRKVSFSPDKHYYELYGRFLKYSPDSTKFIDLDSYNIDIEKDGKGQLIGYDQGPDTEVSLVEPASKQKTRLVFMGPGNSIEDAAWIDNDNIILMGIQENDSATATDAVAWRINLPSRSFYMYELKDDSLANALKDYSRKERLKGVVVK